MSLTANLLAHAGGKTRCPSCDFELWHPVASLGSSYVGLYDDARFPGRLIVSLRKHYDHLDEVPEHLMVSFMADVAKVSRVLRRGLDAERVNVAILGNQESHVHAHVIPRRSTDPSPDKSPWQDPRPLARLDPEHRLRIVETFREFLV